ncbi:MAG: STAS domain-containing protein [Pseudomonadota bacterium]
MAKLLLAAKLDTSATTELRDALVAAQDEDVVIDGGAVQMIGGACTELLLSAAAIWRAAGHGFALENPSSQMVDDLGTLGLTPDSFLEDAA